MMVDPNNLEVMLQAYIAAALWSTCAPEDLGIEMLDEMFEPEHFTEEAMRRCRLDCAAFLDYAMNGTDGCAGERSFKSLLEGCDFSQVGHDFWLTREGHGVGFWDRPEIYGDDEAEALTKLCKAFGEVYLEAYIDEGTGEPRIDINPWFIPVREEAADKVPQYDGDEPCRFTASRLEHMTPY